MSTLVINGIVAPLHEGDLKSQPEQVGESGRAASGTWRNHRRMVKLAWDLTLRHMTFVEAAAWASVIRGEHHTFSFDSSLYSSKGQAPTAGYTATLAGSGAKYGADCLRVPNATTISWPLGLGGNRAGDPASWTVMVWRKESGTWHHYVVNSSGQKWLDGVRADATSTTFIAVGSAGEVTLTGVTGLTDFDDLVTFPVPLPTTWPPLLYAVGQAYPLSPRLEAYGDAIVGTSLSVPLYVQGDSNGLTHRGRARFAGTLDRLAATVQATIREE